MPPALGLTRPAPADECAMPAETRTRSISQPCAQNRRSSFWTTSRRSHTYNTSAASSRPPRPSTRKAASELVWATSQPVLAEEPRHERQGQKHGCDQRVSCLMLSFWRRSSGSAEPRSTMLPRGSLSGDPFAPRPPRRRAADGRGRRGDTARARCRPQRTIPARACRAAPATDGRPIESHRRSRRCSVGATAPVAPSSTSSSSLDDRRIVVHDLVQDRPQDRRPSLQARGAAPGAGGPRGASLATCRTVITNAGPRRC